MRSRLLRSALECPVCGSSDGGSIYHNHSDKGEEFLLYKCFSGNHDPKRTSYKINDMENYMEEVKNIHEGKGESLSSPTPLNIHNTYEASTIEKKTGGLLSAGKVRELNNAADPWKARNIREEVARFYGVTVRPDTPVSRNPEVIRKLTEQDLPLRNEALIFPFYNAKGDLVAQKVRTPVNKKGEWYKRDDNAITESGFFGQQLFNSPALREIAITFGEFDAMAVYQMTGTPTVSVTNGDQSAYAQFKKEYNWLNRFKTIYLIPDNDESCRNVLQSLGSLFPSKTKIVMATKHKDPCDYLVAGDWMEFKQEFQAAEYFAPQGILALKDLKSLLFEKPPEPIAQYPWQGLNELTGGIWAGELITIKAPPKVGKSSVMSSIAYHLSKNTDYKIGLIYLEETKRDLVFRFVSFELEKNLQRKEIRETVTKEEINDAADQVFAGDQIFLLDHWGSCSSDFLSEKMTEFVRAKGCQIIFFDHISMAITDESNKDERIALDRLVATIKALTTGIPDYESEFVREENKWVTRTVIREPTIFMVTHVNDDGKTRGSRAAVQQSNLVLSLSRDKLAKNPTERNILDIIVEENRRLGESGLACRLYYDKTTSLLQEVPMAQEGEEEDVPVMDRGNFNFKQYTDQLRTKTA